MFDADNIMRCVFVAMKYAYVFVAGIDVLFFSVQFNFHTLTAYQKFKVVEIYKNTNSEENFCLA